MSDELLSKDCDASVVRDLAAGLSEINNAADGSKPFVIVPDKYRIHDLEDTLAQPLAIRATPSFSTLDGLIGYVETYKGNNTAIFIDMNTGSVVAILDYHGKPGDAPASATAKETRKAASPASWCRHRAHHTPKHTVEWQRWTGKNDQWLDQRSFAEFIENNVADITKPSGAQMLEIASTLEAKTAVEFKSGVRLDNGSSRLTFASDTVAKAGDKGTLDIPQQFELAIEPFIGGEAYPLVARFRYKIEEGKLKLRYQLINPHKVIEAAVAKIIEKVGTGTAVKPFIGQP